MDSNSDSDYESAVSEDLDESVGVHNVQAQLEQLERLHQGEACIDPASDNAVLQLQVQYK